MDTSDQTLTFDAFLTWKTEALREYLGKRGLAKDKAKQELAALCYSAHVMKIPEIPSAAENVKVRQFDYQNLLNVNGTTIPDPFTLHKNWADERDGMKSWPPVYLSDIIEYAGVCDTNFNITKFLQQYKLGKGQSFVDAGHTGEIFHHQISKESTVCLVRSDCIPSQHIKDDPHKIWICVEKETGTIRSSYCTCTAGLGSPCVHVVSVLFRIETAHRLGVSACTSLPCSWTVPAFKSTRAPPSKLKELEVSKPVHSLTCGKKRSLVSTIKKEFNPVHTGNTTKDCLKDITDAIRNSIPNACVFKGIDIPKEEVKIRTEEPVNIQKYMLEKMVMDGLEGPSIAHNLRQETVEALNKATMGQHANSTWHNLRKGRITSSNFHSVQCKIEYNRSETVVKPLLCNIMGYTSVNPNLKPLKHGREMEPIARSEYVSFMKKNHRNVIVSECGIFIDPVRPYLAATPDLLVSCSCCGNGVAEFKCPMISKCNDCTDFCTCHLPACLNFQNCQLSLNHNHSYFAQVQGQMGITGRPWCDFFVYTCNGIFCERITFDDKYYKELLFDLDKFFKSYIVPEIKTRKVKDCLSVEREEEPMETDSGESFVDGSVYFCPICNNVVQETVHSYKAQSIQCDNCKLWFHFPCVKMTKANLKNVQKWICPKC